MSYDSLIVNDLPAKQFIGGTKQTYNFEIYDSDGSPLDLTGCTCVWKLAPYGDPSHETLSLNGTVSGSPLNYMFTVIISGSNTEDLSGKFLQQPYIIDVAGNELRPSQGYVTIIPRIGTD